MFTGARTKTGNGLAAGCQLFYRKIYGYFLQCTRFHWSPSIGKSRKTPVTSVKTAESNEVCRLADHLGSTFIGTGRNRPNYRIGPDIAAIPVFFLRCYLD